MARGRGVSIDGVDDFIRGMSNGYRVFNSVMREIMRSDLGETIKRDMKKNMAGHMRTGRTIRQVRVQDLGNDGVKIGVFGDRQFIGTFLESGVKPHIINPGAQRTNRSQSKRHRAGALNVNGRWVTHVQHPGTRRYRIAENTLRANRADIERAVIAGFENRLGKHIGGKQVS